MQVADALGGFAGARAIAVASAQWEAQLDALRDRVQSWTGNPLQIVDLSLQEWRHPAHAHRALLSTIQHDATELYPM